MATVIERLRHGGIENILITGGGEPLSNSAVALFGMRQAKEAGMKVALYTNGYFLTPEISAQLLACTPTLIRVSIYGSDSEAFAAYTLRPAQYYRSVLQKVRYILKELAPETGSTIGLSYLVHPLTMRDVERLPDALFEAIEPAYLRKLGYIRFTPAIDYYGGAQQSLAWLAETFGRIRSAVVPRLSPYTNAIIYEHRLHGLYAARGYDQCRASNWYLEVGTAGEVYLCCERLLTGSYMIGNLLADSVDSVLRGRCPAAAIRPHSGSQLRSLPASLQTTRAE